MRLPPPDERVNTDLLIVGDGPAGLAAAIAVARRRPDLGVVLLRRRSPMPPIGESLPPGVRPYLDALGIWPQFLIQRHRPSFGTTSCWGRPGTLDNPFVLHAEGRGWQLQRERFDQLLADTARDLGARLLDATFQRCRTNSEGSGWLVDGDNYRFRCRLLVDASGRNAALARRLGAEPLRHDRLVGVYRFFSAVEPGLPGPLVEAWEHGWWYSAGRPGGGLVCAAMVDADGRGEGGPNALRTPEGWRQALRSAPHTADRLAGAVEQPGVWVKPAYSQCLDRCIGPSWIAIGDACHCTDPLAADGIRRALHDGLGLGALLADGDHDWTERMQRYKLSQRQAFAAYVEARTHYYRQETRWPGSRFWTRRHEFIRLHPHDPVAVGTECALRGTGRLRRKDRALLAQLATAGEPAGQLLRGFRATCSYPYTDRQLLLSVQELVN